MTTCNQCRAELTPAEQSSGRCSRCGHVHQAELKPATLPDVRVDQTMEFAGSDDGPDIENSSPEGAKKPGTVADVRVDRTMDFATDSPGPSDAADFDLNAPAEPERKSGTIHEREHLQTMDFGPGGAAGGDDLIDVPTGKATDHENRKVAVTHDSDLVNSDLVSVLSVAWGDELQSQVSPRFTLKGREAAGGKPDQTLVVNARAVRDARQTDAPPKLADYELLDVLGEGGMGVVYAARQASIDRTVAIKMLKPKMSGNRDLQQKFLSEAVVTGDLDHPNIVPMYDLGKNEAGALFYAMKRVQGTPWSKAIAQKSQFENIDILLKAADAVAFAHARGVVHRDLKPENIMLGEFGEVLVMDWGLAYSTPSFRKSGSITQTHSMGGSPAYMAPEMAMGPIERITFASDIYLLGAILYEIVTGKPPHTGANVSQCLTNAARNEILPTEKTGELVDIARRAMASQPADRYPSVQAFQTAIRDYLAHNESIALSARSEGELAKARADRDYREFARALFGFEEALKLWAGNDRARDGAKAARMAYAECAFEKGDFDLAAGLLDASEPGHAELRTKIVAAQGEREARQLRLRRAKRFAAALVVGLFVVGGVAYFGIRIQRDRARHAEEQAKHDRDRAIDAEGQAKHDRDRAVDAEAQAVVDRDRARDAEADAKAAKEAEEYEAYVARIGLAAAKIEENAFDGALQLLGECPEKLRGWEWGRLKYLCERARYTYQVGGRVAALAYDAETGRCAAGTIDGGLQIRELPGGRIVAEPKYGGGKINAVAFSPDGSYLAVGGDDRRGFAQLFDAKTGGAVRSFVGHGGEVAGAVFDPGGKYLATASTDGTARIWDLASGAQIGLIDAHLGPVWAIAWSPDGATIVTGGDDGSAVVSSFDEIRKRNNAPNKDPVRAFMAHKQPVRAVAFSPRGEYVASGGDDDRVLVWKPSEVKPYRLDDVLSETPSAPPTPLTLAGHSDDVYSIAYSPDGDRIASAGLDNTVVVHELAGGAAKTLRGHAGHVRACSFMGIGPLLASAGFDETIKVWDIDAYSESQSFGPLVFAGKQPHTDAVLAADITSDARRVATAGNDRKAKLWELDSRTLTATLDEGHDYLTSTAIVTPDGKRLITAAGDGTASVWDTQSVTQTVRIADVARGAAAAISRDGRFLALAKAEAGAPRADGQTPAERYFAAVYEVETGALVRALPTHRTEVTAAAFSPDGKHLFTGESSGRANLWRLADGGQVWSVSHHSDGITAAAFTRNGSRVLTASLDNVVGAVDPATGAEYQAEVLRHPDCVMSLVVLGDDRAATACEDGVVRVWTLGNNPRGEALPLAGGAFKFVAASGDGNLVAAVDQQTSTVRIWNRAEAREVRAANVATDAPWLDLKPLGGLAWAAAFMSDDQSLVVAGDKEARRFELKSASQVQVYRPHGSVAGIAFTPDDKFLATAGDDGSIRIWSVAEHRAVQKLDTDHVGAINSLAYNSDGTMLLTAGDDGTAKLWNLADGKPVQVFRGHEGRVTHAAFSSDGKQVVTSSADRHARVFDVRSGRMVRDIAAHGREALWAEFSPTGDLLVTAGADDVAFVWNLADGKQLARLEGHTARVGCAAFSPDGVRIVTGSQDGTVKIWDVRTAKEMLTLKGHAQEVTSVRFARTGNAVLSSGRDHVAIVWPAADWP